jgi:putative hydrolase
VKALPRFDWHVHANYTDGHASVDECIRKAEQEGLASIALTEHVRADSDWIERYCGEVSEAAKKTQVQVWCGAEARILNEAGDIHLSKDAVKHFDLIVASVHRLPDHGAPFDPQVAYVNALVNACENPLVDILGHPTHLPKELAGWGMSDAEQVAVAKAAARNGVAIEVNRKYDVPSIAFLKICLSEGCIFSVGSDAHRAEDVGAIDELLEKLSSVGVTSESLAYTRWK